VVAPCAKRLARKFPRLIRAGGLLTPEDLHSIGQEALLRAARAYDAKKARDFVTYAKHVVRYRMLDAIDHLLFEERVKRAAERAEANYGAFFADDDYNVMKHDEAETRRRYRAFASGLFTAMFTAAVEEAEQCLAEAEEEVRRAYLSALDALRRAMSCFTEADRRLLFLVYRDGLLLDDAAARLGIGYSTARAHHTRVLKVLHELLVAQGIVRAPRPLVVPEAGEILGPAAAHNDTGPPGPG
jgi:RNA polymerase sigma factor (sigma-70 family)